MVAANPALASLLYRYCDARSISPSSPDGRPKGGSCGSTRATRTALADHPRVRASCHSRQTGTPGAFPDDQGAMTEHPASIDQVLECLNHYRIRATYTAVAGVLGCYRRQVGPQYLRKASPLTSWVVTKATHQPGDPEYREQPLLVHPDLERSDYVIETAEELRALITAFKIRPVTEWP